MRWLQSFWVAKVAHFGSLDGPLSIDLEVPFFRLKLYFNYAKFHLNPFRRFRLADLLANLFIYYITNHCALRGKFTFFGYLVIFS